MSGIPVLSCSGNSIAETWEKSLLLLREQGCEIKTQYDNPDDPPSSDATMMLTIHEPLSEPMIHLDLPGGYEDLQEYVMEVCDGIKDHLIRDPNDPEDTRWEYTYHQRLFKYEVPSLSESFDQIETMCQTLAKAPHTRRAQAVTWKVWEDNDCYDPACLQSLWCRIIADKGVPWLNMNVRIRSNDAYKAAAMNIFAFVQLQKRIAERVSELMGHKVHLGRYCHMADSYHIYGKDLKEFEARFMNAVNNRTFENRTVRYEDVKDQMEAAVPRILEKVKGMAREKS